MLSTAERTWTDCLNLIRENVTDYSYAILFQATRGLRLENKTLTVGIANQFLLQKIDGSHHEVVNRAASQILGDDAKVEFCIYPPASDLPAISEKTTPVYIEPAVSIPRFDAVSQLSLHYTFNNFVEGDGNQFAKAASLAVAEAPGRTTFNPLFIYGGVGLGKTHLIQAIGNHALNLKTVKSALYVSSEKFTNEFIAAIQNNRTTEFSSVYRNVDLLLVDDVQFFIDRGKTQEQFFHTFNTLHQKGKQIVLSSDRSPKDFTGIEERLLSRMQWGLVVDIQPPDLETRMAILQKKAEENHIEIPGEVIQLIAQNITNNIRELEGALIKLLAYASMNHLDVSINLARHILKDMFVQKHRNLNIDDIQKEVSLYYGIPDDMMRAKTRRKEVALARQIAMFLSKKLTKHSLKTIGLHFGGRDHTTVIHAIETIENLIKNDNKIREEIDILERNLLCSFP
ncbi:MAG: chromosomal replication initiator protein DnaA [candidate division KSB1 bacterium]|nr:chromosomal replication initiator protein DnaA [candidate division KSB1 bacterium]MDZ7301960.1 chromosomal replication initiator protein DnaA [candidate division KSB1 bacterium]MDZ7312365.1 chromosomal replication initiator protein DnaA [candidate division KSB1 bacterium]